MLARFGRDKGADIPTRTDYVRALKPLLDIVGNERALTIILFTLDETSYARELAPLAGHYPVLKLGPPWWFHDSPEGMLRFREQATETAGFYNTVGFNDDTRAFLSIPARHDVARRIDCRFLATLVTRAPHRRGRGVRAGARARARFREGGVQALTMKLGVALIAMALPSLAFAAHPLVTEDPGTQGRGTHRARARLCRVARRPVDPRAQHDRSRPQLSLGVADERRSHRAGGPSRNRHPRKDRRSSAQGSALIDVKWRFTETETLGAGRPRRTRPADRRQRDGLGSGRARSARDRASRR